MGGDPILEAASRARRPRSDLLDPRQREAAALLLTAIDLPADMHGWAKHALEAARIAPGLTINALRLNSRRAALERARALIDTMLEEGA